jgi:hypothetical protein
MNVLLILILAVSGVYDRTNVIINLKTQRRRNAVSSVLCFKIKIEILM